jgi:arabinose-5-phosphate isomerase
MIVSRGQEVIQIEADALLLLARSLDDSFVAACEQILACPQRLIVTGMGKSGHVARKIAATFSATGTPAMYLHPAEAAHGDLGMLARGDTLLVLSNSGNTVELRPVLSHARQCGIPIIGIASHRASMVIRQADIALCLPHAREACAANIAPTTSTTLQLALGDALAMAVMDMRGISSDDLFAFHPGGAIGMRMTPVGEIMHAPDRLPLLPARAPMSDAIFTMTSGGFGIAGVIDDSGLLIGVITDGDVRRHFDQLTVARAQDIMSSEPKTLSADTPAQDALLLFSDSKITAAFVVAPQVPQRPIGIVHIHDFVRFGLS